MVTPNEVYAEYSKHGGLSGICEEILVFMHTNWEEHDIVKEWFKKAVEIYQKAFPKGRPPKTPSEAIRRISIFAAHLGRLRRLKSPRLLEFEKLYREYSDYARRMMYYRDAWRDIRKYDYFYAYIKDLLKSAKTTNKVDLYFEAIKAFHERTTWILNRLKNSHPNAYEIWKFFADRFNLGTLWFEFTYALTADTEDAAWGYRMLEIHLQTWTHAELLFIELTDKRLSEVVEKILYLTENHWLLNFDEFGGMPFEYESKQLLRFIQGTIPKDVEFKFGLFDHNYNYERVKAWGRIPWYWQKLSADEIIDSILKTGDIVYYEVRGTQGRLEKGTSYIKKKVTVEGIEIKRVERVIHEGVQKSIKDFLKGYSIKEKLKKQKR